MKMLIIGSRIPWPLHDGGAIATYQMLQGLAELGVEITYFTFNTRKHFVSPQDIQTHFPFCRVIACPLNANPNPVGALLALLQGKNYNISRFSEPVAKLQLRALLQKEQFDWVQLEGLYASPFLDVIKPFGIRISLRQHNAEFQIWERLSAQSANPVKRWYYSLLARQLKRYEQQVLKQVDALIPITANDEALFRSMGATVPAFVAPVGLQIGPSPATLPVSHDCFHLGSMEWMPNVEAVKWLINEVWPKVLQKIPNAKLHLAGKGMLANDSRFSGAGIVVHGEVQDAQQFMKSHGIMLVPVFSAGGIRVKILEGFNAGIPVISTSVGAAGIPVENQKHLILADTSVEFASAICALTADKQRKNELVQHAYSFVKEQFSAIKIIRELLVFYHDNY